MFHFWEANKNCLYIVFLKTKRLQGRGRFGDTNLGEGVVSGYTIASKFCHNQNIQGEKDSDGKAQINRVGCI